MRDQLDFQHDHRIFSLTKMASAHATGQTRSDLTERERYILREDFSKIDPEAEVLIKLLRDHGAAECWHKHSTFLEHLVGVWRIMSLWEQSQDVARFGMFHSAYSNSFVNLAIFKPNADRQIVRDAVGTEAERLVLLSTVHLRTFR